MRIGVLAGIHRSLTAAVASLRLSEAQIEAKQNAEASSVPAVLHMLCGKIGSGKSTLAKRLAAGPKTVLISEDDWLACLYPNEIHAIESYVRYAGRLREAMAGHIVALLTAGTSVVLDFPANTIITRAWARGVFEKAGASHLLHYLHVTDDVCKARLHARNVSGEHPFETTDAQFDQFTTRFVAPKTEEGFDVIRHG